MKRRWFMIFGVFATALPLVILLAFGFPSAAEPATTLLLGGMILAGIMFVLGGLDLQFGQIEWYQFVGAGNVLCGISFGLSQLIPILIGTSAYDSSTQLFLALCVVVGGTSMVFIGADWIRGGHHFDLSVFKPGPILLSRK